MVPLSKLRGIVVPEEYKYVYRHYLEGEMHQVEVAHEQLISILDTSHTGKKSQQINKKLKSEATFSKFRDKVYRYFLKILYVLINDKDSYDKAVSVKTCIKDACEYAIAEYLSKSIIESVK